MGRRDKPIFTASSIGARLRFARQEKGISLTEMAKLLGYTKGYLSGAENASRPTSHELVQSYERVLGLKPGKLSELSQTEFIAEPILGRQYHPETFPSFWNVPHLSNPFFTGREDVLHHLHDMLTANKAIALTQAISGLGGIGKTQTAVEYIYRHHDEYKAVLWAKADSYETLVADFIFIAGLLNLPEKNSNDQSLIVTAVQQWLKDHSGWLLILDNVEDMEIVKRFIPSANKGHILITTRSQATGETAQSLEIEKMKTDEGALFLLRRAKIIERNDSLDYASTKYRDTARKISRILDGLPLALDQAGAYIEETKSSLSDYLDLYQMQRSALLKERGKLATSHPDSVATTFSLAFEEIQMANPSAGELLRFCAFLYPDEIPEEIIIEGKSELGEVLHTVAANPFKLNEAIRELLRFSLIRRDADTHTLTIHRLVQAVLRDEMDMDTQYQWATRAVRAINRVFPEVTFSTWHRCQRYLPHAQVCASYIKQWNMAFPEAAQLLNRAGFYLEERGQYTEALELLKRALVIRDRVLGSEHPDTATSLNNLALLYYSQGSYDKSEQLYLQALAIREQVLGPEHPDIANSLNNLVSLYQSQGAYEKAESFLKRALTIREQVLGPEHPDTADSLNDLALLYYSEGEYEKAELLLKRALAIREQVLGPEHPSIATSFNNLAELYERQDKYEHAELLYQQALAIDEKAFGPEHPELAADLNNLAVFYYKQGKYKQAEPAYQRALAIYEKALGLDHPDTLTVNKNYTDLLHKTNRKTEAGKLETRAK